MIKAAIFDVDGTLLDSMPIWLDAGARYLRSIGIEPKVNLSKVLWNMSISEGVSYIKEQYHLKDTKEDITEGLLSTIKEFYYYEVSLKPGVLSFLKTLKEKQIPMVIATSSDESYLDAAFKRTKIDGFFEKIFTCKEVGVGKTSPLIYEAARNYLSTKLNETYVFEDALFAVESAKSAGFKVVGLYDKASDKETNQIKEVSDIYLKDFTESKKFWSYINKK